MCLNERSENLENFLSEGNVLRERLRGDSWRNSSRKSRADAWTKSVGRLKGLKRGRMLTTRGKMKKCRKASDLAQRAHQSPNIHMEPV
jgi:hypothetical protein